MTTLDVAALRAATPGASRVAHFNNAGAGLPTAAVLNTVLDYLRWEAEIGGYEAAAASSDQLTAAYTAIATMLGTTPDRIAYVDSATTAWLNAFTAIPLTRGQRILTTRAEYASNMLQLMHTAATAGVTIEVIPDGPDGAPDAAAFADLLGPDVAVVAVTHTPSHNGLVADVVAIGEALRASGSEAFYLVDGCQSVGQMDVDVNRIGCDAFSATGRKFLRGPRATGFLYVGDRLRDLPPSRVDLHSAEWTDDTEYRIAPDARRFETWERSPALVLGLGKAVEEFLALGAAEVQQHVCAVAQRIRDELAAVPGVVVRDRGTVRSGIVTFTHDAADAATLVPSLRERGVNTSLSSSDYQIPDFRAEGTTSKVRVSPHVYTDDNDIDRLIEAVRAV